ncbi:MAG: sigma-54-dependent Fis family transcriptional regulator [Thermoguttaceae bacterium]|nr:sigma-54-dependent Fis family transcriptional regulator [Thermoguttaceae bacterium]
MKIRVLIVDNEPSLAETVAEALQRKGYECQCAFNGVSGCEALAKSEFDVVITDLVMEDIDGFGILRKAKELQPNAKVIMMTGHGSIPSAVAAMANGAYTYLQKPLDLKQLRETVDKAAELAVLRNENLNLRQRLDKKFGFEGIVGSSAAMQKVIERLKRIAPTDATVLIQGETGTGKEMVAQSIHQNSPRKNKPFVGLNCGALSENILESELFGHVRGAFTDAVSDRVGKFEFADGGTLFLDEVGDMPMPTQIKLLRVLESGEITRVGSNKSIKVNVRLLSATNRNLEQAVADGSFRADLYHRIKVVTVNLPPLRERREDIPMLVDFYVRLFAERNNKEIKAIAPSIRKRLIQFSWPGNIRQLRNVIESMIVFDIDGVLDTDDAPDELLDGFFVPDSTDEKLIEQEKSPLLLGSESGNAESNSSDETDSDSSDNIIDAHFVSAPATPSADADSLQALVGQPLEEVEKRFIELTLKAVGGNREEAAKSLQIGQRTLYRKIKDYNL